VTHAGSRSATGVEHLFVVQRLASHTGCKVRHQRNAQDFGSCFPGRDGLKGGGHADQVPTHGPHHADLGGGFVVRAGELHVHTFIEARIEGFAHGTKAR
jgi:hypothetical protein